MSSGKIVQIIGAVIDVEFPRETVPQVYDALNVDGKPIVLEVQQQLEPFLWVVRPARGSGWREGGM